MKEGHTTEAAEVSAKGRKRYAPTERGVRVRVPKGRRMTFVADFVYERQMPDRTWNEMIEDVKGFDTPTARVKRAIAEQPFGTKIELVRAEKRAAR